jgi:hypothetical protein
MEAPCEAPLQAPQGPLPEIIQILLVEDRLDREPPMVTASTPTMVARIAHSSATGSGNSAPDARY